jgi:hypothetical protein
MPRTQESDVQNRAIGHVPVRMLSLLQNAHTDWWYLQEWSGGPIDLPSEDESIGVAGCNRRVVRRDGK